MIEKAQRLPFKLVGNSVLGKRINDIACLAIRECRGKTARKKKELLTKTRSVTVGTKDIAKVPPEHHDHMDIDDINVTMTMASLEVEAHKREVEKVSSALTQANKGMEMAEEKLNNYVAEVNVLQEQNSNLTKQVWVII